MRNEINRKDSGNTALIKSIKNDMKILPDALKRVIQLQKILLI